jgi:branched-chain amino acid aminotransferase
VAAHTARSVPESLFEEGASACRSRVPVRPAMLARLKTTNYLPNVLMVLEAARRGVDFSFSFDGDGCLAEAAVAHVALVDAGGVLVMPEFRNALPGTTGRKAAELAERFMSVAWRSVPEADLFAAREILMLGTAHECLGIVRYEDRVIGEGVPGPVARRLRDELQSALQDEGVPF